MQIGNNKLCHDLYVYIYIYIYFFFTTFDFFITLITVWRSEIHQSESACLEWLSMKQTDRIPFNTKKFH